MARFSVVIPAFREAGRIGRTLQRLREGMAPLGGAELVVVDDGSPDGTADAARRAGADQVIVLPENRGKGAAVRRGMLAAHGQARAFTDADLAYSPDQLAHLLLEVEAGWDVVIGSRRHVDTSTLVRARRLREVSGRFFNLVTRLVLLEQYLDTQCGLKAFSAEAARMLFSRARLEGFAFDVELLHLAQRLGLSLREVPVELTSSETSTVRLLRDGPLMVRDLVRVRRWSRSGTYDVAAAHGAAIEGQAGDRPR